MQITVTSREDGVPILNLKAESIQDSGRLEKIKDDIEDAWYTGKMNRKSGYWFNSCGSLRDGNGKLIDISLNLLLGVHPSDYPEIKLPPALNGNPQTDAEFE